MPPKNRLSRLLNRIQGRGLTFPSPVTPAKAGASPVRSCLDVKSEEHSLQHKHSRGHRMDFRQFDRLNRRDLIRGAAMK